MHSRIGITVAICFCMAGAAAGQVVRFETSMGSFDMVLNPTNNPLLQGNVDNMLQYINNESYKGSWINRSQSNFVLQMGGFYSLTKRPQLTIDSVQSILAFAPVQGAPAGKIGLSNTVGTVSFALSGNPANPDTGTSSFFVNAGNNSQLDSAFTVFAAIPDMTVVNQIMALNTIDRTTDPLFGATPNNLAFNTVPVQADGFQVLISRAFVVTDAITTTSDMAAIKSVVAQSASGLGQASSAPIVASASGSADLSAPGAAATSPLAPSTVPEPAGLLLAAIGICSMGFLSRRRCK